MPLFKQIDKLLFGIEELHEIEKQPESIQCGNEAEYDVDQPNNNSCLKNKG